MGSDERQCSQDRVPTRWGLRRMSTSGPTADPHCRDTRCPCASISADSSLACHQRTVSGQVRERLCVPIKYTSRNLQADRPAIAFIERIA